MAARLILGSTGSRTIDRADSSPRRLAGAGGRLVLGPVRFGTDVRSWQSRALAITILPFSDYYSGSVWNAAGQIFRKARSSFRSGC